MTLLERLEAANTDPGVAKALAVVHAAARQPHGQNPEVDAALVELLTEEEGS